MAMANDQWSPWADIIDVLIAVGIKDMAATATDDKPGRQAYGAESPYRTVNAAGNGFFRSGEKLFWHLCNHFEYLSIQLQKQIFPWLNSYFLSLNVAFNLKDEHENSSLVLYWWPVCENFGKMAGQITGKILNSPAM